MTVDADRLRDLTLELVEVESPTGDTAEVARLYARRLEEIGMEVELLDDVFPATPTVVGAAARRRAGADDRAERPPRHGADPARRRRGSRTARSTGAARPT